MQALILNAISELPLVFKGGTYLWFFHGLRRFSEDLDFTASGKLPDETPQKTSESLSLFGVENELKIMTNDQTALSYRIIANGPLNTSIKDRCVVYVEISKREPVIEKTMPLRFNHPEYQLPIRFLSGMSLDEVGAEKVRATVTRRRVRDIYDLYYLITSKKIGFKREAVERKLSYYRKTFSKKEFLGKVNERRGSYSKELQSIVFEELPPFSVVKKAIGKWISNPHAKRTKVPKSMFGASADLSSFNREEDDFSRSANA